MEVKVQHLYSLYPTPTPPPLYSLDSLPNLCRSFPSRWLPPEPKRLVTIFKLKRSFPKFSNFLFYNCRIKLFVSNIKYGALNVSRRNSVSIHFLECIIYPKKYQILARNSLSNMFSVYFVFFQESCLAFKGTVHEFLTIRNFIVIVLRFKICKLSLRSHHDRIKLFVRSL